MMLTLMICAMTNSKHLQPGQFIFPLSLAAICTAIIQIHLVTELTQLLVILHPQMSM